MQFLLGYPLKQKKFRNCKVYPTIDYVISNDIIFQPDMLIVCGEIKKKFLDFPPVLTAEILSPVTLLRDKHTKFKRYREQGVRYYLMVDTDKETFQLYELIHGSYVLCQHNFNEPFSFQLEEGCTIEVTLNEIW